MLLVIQFCCWEYSIVWVNYILPLIDICFYPVFSFYSVINQTTVKICGQILADTYDFVSRSILAESCSKYMCKFKKLTDFFPKVVILYSQQ